MARFHRTSRGIEARFHRHDVQVLRQLLGWIAGLLAEEADPDASTDPLEAIVGVDTRARERPDDPVLARLLPDAYDDADAASEYRRYTERGLREGKVEAARTALATLERGGRVVLDDEQAQAWLTALNDLRLALGVRLDVTDDTGDEIDRLPEDDPRKRSLIVFSWLGWLQETLVESVAGW